MRGAPPGHPGATGSDHGGSDVRNRPPVVRLLGPVLVRGRDGPLPFAGAKPQLLLCLLAAEPGVTVSCDRLIDSLWDGAPPPSADDALRGHVRRLRRVFEAVPPPAPAVVNRHPGYALEIHPAAIDVGRWHELLEAARHAAPEEARWHLETALELWGGEPFGGLTDERLRLESRHLQETHEIAWEQYAEALVRLRDHHTAIPLLERLAGAEPLRERRTLLLMIALFQAGRQADAQRAYRDLSRRLHDEHGSVPLAELRDAELAVLNGREPDLGPEARPRPARVAPALPSWLRAALDTTMVGRDELLAELLRQADVPASPAGDAGIGVLLLRGDPGVGKTRLLAEVGRVLGDRGAQVLAGWCDAEGVVPFQPVMEAFREILDATAGRPTAAATAAAATVRRHLAGGPDDGRRSDPETDRLRFFEAMVTLLHSTATGRPLVLVVDDIHWLDRSSEVLLRHLLRRPPSGPVLLAAGYRNDIDEHTAAWTRMLNDLRKHRRVTLVDVPELTDDAAKAVIAGLTTELGTGDAGALAERVLPVTGRNPLLIRETVTQLVLSPRPDDGTGAVPVPERLRESVATRLATLSRDAQWVVGAAAVVAREFTLDDVAALTNRGVDEVLELLDEARSARLLEAVPHGADRFAFGHALIREAVLQGLPRPRRLRMHLAAGTAAVGRNDAGSALARAHHLLEAVPLCAAETAARAAAEAADAALAALAFEEAARVLLRALALTAADDEHLWPLRFDLLLRLGRAHCYRGADTAGDDAFADAADIARALADPARLALAALGDDPDTRALTPSPARLSLLAESLRALEGDESPLRVSVASAYVMLGSLAHGAGWVRPLADETVLLARRLDLPLPLAKALLAWTTCTNTTVDPEQRLAVTTEAMAFADTAGHLGRAARARLIRIATLLRLGRADEAVAEHGRYRAAAEATRIPRALWQADIVDATLLGLRGRVAASQAAAERALAAGQRSGIAEAAMAFGVHFFFAHLHRGEVAQLRPLLDEYVGQRPDLLLWRLGAGLSATAAGDPAAARQALDHYLAVLPLLDPDGEFWSDELVLASQLAAELGAGDAREALEPLLAPCAGQFEVFGAASGTLGPVDRALGLLAGLGGDHDEACLRLAAARALCRRMDAASWELWTGADLVRHLRAGGRPAEADDVLASLAPLRDRLGTEVVERRLAGG